MLDLEIGRQGPPPKDAATLIVVRDGEAGLEVFCVVRHKSSAFLGGAVVFPGGKLDPEDGDAAWSELVNAPRASAAGLADDPAVLRGLAIAACREALEEAAILPVTNGTVTHDEALALRALLEKGGTSLRELLAARGLKLDLAALVPLSRWVTPVVEARRFDTRFFLLAAPPGQHGAHDERETTSSFWATPREVLARFDAETIQLAPPTHRTLELLAPFADVAAAVKGSIPLSLAPICPEAVQVTTSDGDTMALTLPGDPLHSVKERRIEGTTRFVLRGSRFVPENP